MTTVRNVLENLLRMQEYEEEEKEPPQEGGAKDKYRNPNITPPEKRKRSEQYKLYSEMSLPDLMTPRNDMGAKKDEEMIMIANIMEILFQATREMSEEEIKKCHPFLNNLIQVTQWCHDENICNVAVPMGPPSYEYYESRYSESECTVRKSATSRTPSRKSSKPKLKTVPVVRVSKIKLLQTELEGVQASLENNDSSLSSIRESIGALSKQMMEQQESIQMILSKISQQEEKISVLDASNLTRMDTLESQTRSMMTRVTGIEKNVSGIKPTKDEMDAVKSEVNELRRDSLKKDEGFDSMTDVKQSIEALASRIEMLESRANSFHPDSSQNAELPKQVEALARQSKKLEEKMSTVLSNMSSGLISQPSDDIDQKFRSINSRITEVEKSREQAQEKLEGVSQATDDIKRKNASIASTIDGIVHGDKDIITEIRRHLLPNDEALTFSIKNLEQKMNNIEAKVAQPRTIELNPEVLKTITNVNSEALASMRQQIENLSKTVVHKSEAMGYNPAERYDTFSFQPVEESGFNNAWSPASSSKRFKNIQRPDYEDQITQNMEKPNWNILTEATPVTTVNDSTPPPPTAFEKRMQVLEERHARLRQALKRDDY